MLRLPGVRWIVFLHYRQVQYFQTAVSESLGLAQTEQHVTVTVWYKATERSVIIFMGLEQHLINLVSVSPERSRGHS